MGKNYRLIAHRGVSSLCPQNTKSSFLKVLDFGLEAIELDLRLTKDNVWVVVHDADIAHHSNGKGIVEEMFLDELRRFEFGSWFSSEFKDEKILTLQELCGLVFPKCALILDIKTQGDTEKIAKSLVDALEKYSAEEVIISSFSLELLKKIKVLSPEMKLGYLVKDWGEWRTRTAVREGFFSIHPLHKIFTSEMAEMARIGGVKVFVWTVNRPEDAERLFLKGADGIFTDFPQRMKACAEVQERGAYADK